MSSIDQQFVEYIVKSLVSNPEAVVIERRIDEKGVLLELTVDPEDLGRVIGKRGATAQSLRTLLRALGTKNDARYNLKIVDNGEPGMGGSSHGASSDDNGSSSHHSDDDAHTDDDETYAAAPAASSSVVDKTRKELEELDDLDV
ncbi:MAG TPA: KH domain-containing protein [Candidatus Saccharimonadales bacterium]